MKLLLSYIFYIIGDIISKTIMTWGDGYGYPVYKKFMLWSVDLDTCAKIWKKPTAVKKRKRKL